MFGLNILFFSSEIVHAAPYNQATCTTAKGFWLGPPLNCTDAACCIDICKKNGGVGRLGPAEGASCCCKAKTTATATASGVQASDKSCEEKGDKIECKFGFGLNTSADFAARAVKALLGIVGSLGLAMFVWGGFLWLTAAGEEKRIKQGWETMVWAAVGMGAIFGAYAITDTIIGALQGAAT